ncbi:MarR family winged helix-turn-helix transcriptional regulator [Levilactobacillus tujiorum]|uniref:Winged helix-turn-helix transcriptional regulator n=1 Tax=Levilactobacillus tujiorum TaxID=2912243 RepID=A0ABX1L4B1_9LACO|nr:MarR family winged helix-turn-helix transcriptional regulator [Levilactobacillus tujiorum]MCH5464825.1 MarR family winged helix-turn-helix transcriptional regulator [Levilactobacillus tujiorum]NLR11877.1 winged helix-turn-helix transcriptional regulator [Lactobacillus sp. HBUAS51387]NLR29861.1 winged helix-turn-helix transcriptional regulator [Levilactobacillus tujiorum]
MATSQFDLDSCIMCITSRSSKLFASKFNDALAPMGINRSSWMALYYIDQQQQIRQRDLAELVGVTGPSMVKIVNQLSSSDLITVTVSAKDHRARLLTLTPAGSQLLTQSIPLAEDFRKQVTAGIPQADLNTLNRVMEQMMANANDL